MNTTKVITIKDNEKYLRQISKDVSFDDKKLPEYIETLEKYCIEHEVLAMAAIQLKIPKRIVYLKNTNLELIGNEEKDPEYNEARILINPIIKSKEGLTDYWEACASCLDNFGHIRRPYKIIVEYFDINGNKKEENFEGFETTVLCHEIDHLDGILHMDIADEVTIMKKEDRKVFRETHGYNIISKTGDFEQLKKDNIIKKVLNK